MNKNMFLSLTQLLSHKNLLECAG